MSNYCILYDGTFIGLLTTIKYLLKNKIKPTNIIEENKINFNMFDNFFKPNITNDVNFIKIILNISSKQILKIIYYVYLSNNKNKELIIYYFLLNTFIYKEKIIYQRNLKCVNEAHKISQHVKRETHKLKGFTRFKMINNKFLYAEISPDNNILELLSKHFEKRLSNELWIIKDTNRNLLSIYDRKKFNIYLSSDITIIELENSNNDTYYEELWKTFFQTIAISKRINKKRQMSFMPKKYWHNIIEMEDLCKK